MSSPGRRTVLAFHWNSAEWVQRSLDLLDDWETAQIGWIIGELLRAAKLVLPAHKLNAPIWLHVFRPF